MCTRYVLLKEHLREILTRLEIDGDADFSSRYNIGPGQLVPAVRIDPVARVSKLAALRWGLVPSWAKSDESAAQLMNARAATLTEKPSFRGAFKSRRCVIPASGFYEWETVGRAKKPWLFRWGDERPFGLAGLWESWRAPNGGVLESCAVITTEPNELMRTIHHRMPVMLTPEQFAPWLDPRKTTAEELMPLLQIPPAGAMSKFAVSSYVSNVRHEGPECLAPAGAGSDETPQLSLGL